MKIRVDIKGHHLRNTKGIRLWVDMHSEDELSLEYLWLPLAEVFRTVVELQILAEVRSHEN